MSQQKFRLVTRSDFDGLVCAVLLKDLGLIDEIKFVHPKDMQDGLVPITNRDITTNLPYVEGCHLAFDHHLSETLRVGKRDNHIIDPDAPSAARVIYNYYGGKMQFLTIPDDMIDAVDQGDSAQYSLDDVLHPKGWTLLNFLMDARTGLGRFRSFRISNYQLMMDLIDYCAEKPIERILELPDVKERVDLYFEQEALFKEQLRRCTTIHGNCIVLDLRDEDPIYAGNRFMIYALNPEQNISIHVIWGPQKQNTVFAVGKSIVNRTSKTDVGPLMLEYGGGGHAAAGTCQVPNENAEALLTEIIGRINADG
ncbi:MAG: exopolyphosphatase [Alphaproteobacteria bacterium]|nr:exopolyphosphatase [Alphaproteobacteria bacterium]TAD86955.1 MAG: exopolyphosphatase [Alphaproteobacteria bacterium]